MVTRLHQRIDKLYEYGNASLHTKKKTDKWTKARNSEYS